MVGKKKKPLMRTLAPRLLWAALLLPCSQSASPLGFGQEFPGWALRAHGGRPPLPFAPSGRLRDVSVAYFLGSAEGFDSAREVAAEARLGIVGVGWQLDSVRSNHSHLEAAELVTAAQLKLHRPAVRVLVARNSEVVSTFWDAARRAFQDATKNDYWVCDTNGSIVEVPWVSPAGNTPSRWINFSNPAAEAWWATEHVGPVLKSPLLDGWYFDCADGDPPGVDPAAFALVKASAQAAVDRILPRAAAAGKW
eukprot:4969222-Prymnesium_polylepis.1